MRLILLLLFVASNAFGATYTYDPAATVLNRLDIDT